MQPRIEVGSHDDEFEREADRNAARVAEDVGQQSIDPGKSSRPPSYSSDTVNAVRRHEDPSHGREVTDLALAERIRNPGPGRPLESETRATLERYLGHDFAAVRLHDDARARSDSARLGAQAFTYGRNVWLGPGAQSSDVRLMAHELTHVIQQGGTGAPARVQRRVQANMLDDGLRKAGEIFDKGTSFAREKAAGTIRKIPGYALLTVALGEDPITGTKVPRSSETVLRGLAPFVPGGADILVRLRQAGDAIQRAYQWFMQQFAALNLGARATAAWKRFTATGNPVAAIEEFHGIVAGVLGLAGRIAGEVAMFVLRGVLSRFGTSGAQVMQVLGRAGSKLRWIAAHPGVFLGNLLSAVGLGFRQFGGNFVAHFGKGFAAWLFGTLGIVNIPKTFDLRGIIGLVLDVLGLTWANVRAKLVAHRDIGETKVAALEKTVDIMMILAKDGLPGIWNQLSEWLGSIQDRVVGAIREWLVTKIIIGAVTKIAGMANPVGAVVTVILDVYRMINYFIERARQFAELVAAIWSSIVDIADGKLAAAAAWIETSMARAIPVLLGGLATLVGLDGIADKIKQVIADLRKPFDRAIEKLIEFVVKKAKGVVAGGRDAAGKVVEWWKQRLHFKVGIENHELYFEGDHFEGDLMIASIPKKAREFLEDIKDPKGDAKSALAWTGAYDLYRKIDRRQVRLRKKLKEDKLTAAESQEVKELIGLRKEFRNKLNELSLGSKHSMESNVTYGDPTNGGGKWMRANPLTVRPKTGTKGSKPQWSGGIWNVVRSRPHGNGSFYILGHLLAERMHGPGSMDNLTPISRTANAKHSGDVEMHVWNAMASGRPIRYNVDVDYDGHQYDGSKIDDAISKKKYNDTNMQKMVRALIVEESKLCTRLRCKASYADNNQTIVEMSIDNDVPSRANLEQGLPDQLRD
ncbi:eCIS core domain-containing protein [Nannocystaceae bacterium ST9]